jgi:hypothetical protein
MGRRIFLCFVLFSSSFSNILVTRQPETQRCDK